MSVALPERDRELLDFEGSWSKADGDKEDLIRAKFGFSSGEYFQRLQALELVQAAHEYAPALMKRMSERRAARVSARLSRSLVIRR